MVVSDITATVWRSLWEGVLLFWEMDLILILLDFYV